MYFIPILLLLLFAIYGYNFFSIKNENFQPFFTTKPLFIAHRGDSLNEPENTLPAYNSAIKQGFTALEMDVVRSHDNRIICSHNFDLEQETNGCGFFDDINFSLLSNISTGIYHPKANPTSLNTLEEVLDKIADNIKINIEIKTTGILDLGALFLVHKLISTHQYKHPFLISSFNPLVIICSKIWYPHILTGLIIENATNYKWLSWIKPDCIHPKADAVTKNMIKHIHDRGQKINVWTVNTLPAINWLKDLGVDGIFTDQGQYINSSGIS